MLAGTPRISGGSGGSSSGVESLNGLTGAVTLSEGQNISLNESGSDIEINANFTQMGKYMISGGVTWSGTGLVYDVSFLTYFFNGNKTADPDSVTLAASDPSNNRFDAVVVDEAGVISVITGTASSSPEVPPIPDDQLQVTIILVEAGSTTPTIASENIYLDDPTSGWTFSTYDTASPATGTINFAGTNSPKQGTECIEASTDLRRGARFVRGTSFDAFQYTIFQVWVRFTGSNVATNKSLNVRFENSAGTLVANTVNLFNYGLQRNVLNTWQLVVVPITAFGALPATVKGLKMIMAGGTVGVVRQWDVDYMILTNGSVPFANVPTINFAKNGTIIAAQPGLNLIEGTGVTITATNNPTNNRVDYTLNAIGGGPAGSNRQIQYNNAGVFGADSNFTRNASTQATLIKAGTVTDYGQISLDNNDVTLTTSFNGGSDFSQIKSGTLSTSMSYSVGGIANTFSIDGSSIVGIVSDGTQNGRSSIQTGSSLISATNEVDSSFARFRTITTAASATYFDGVSKTNGFTVDATGMVLGNFAGGNGTQIIVDETTDTIGFVADGTTTYSSDIPQSIQVTVSDTDMKAVVTGPTPYQLIAAPGAGKFIQILSLVTFLDYNTTPYDFDGLSGLDVMFPSGSGIAVGTFQETSSTILQKNNFNGFIIENEPINLTQGDSTTVTQGDSPVTFYITYKIVTL